MVTVISSVLPVLPILMLLWVQHLLVRIGLILVFTVVFAALLVFGMHMDSDKVLAVTTARVSASLLETFVAESCTASRPSKSPLFVVAIPPHVHDGKNSGLISDSFIVLIRGLETQDRSECLVVSSKVTDIALLIFPC